MRYSAEKRREALDCYREHGPAEAGRRLGIPSGTIRSWARREGLATVAPQERKAAVDAARLTWEQRRCDLRQRFGEVAGELLADLPVTNPNATKNLVTAAAICVDKAESLARAEREDHQLEIPDEIDFELSRLVEEAAERRASELVGESASGESRKAG